MVDTKELRAEFVRNGLTQKEVAEMLGIAEKTLSVKMKTGNFGLDEANGLIKILKLTDPASIFFAQEVS